MKNKIQKFFKHLFALRFAPVYKVLYAPAESRNPFLPVQKYKIIGNPTKLAWRSQAGKSLFTALNANDYNSYIAFRTDRVLSVNFAGVRVIPYNVRELVDKTLTSNCVCSAA